LSETAPIRANRIADNSSGSDVVITNANLQEEPFPEPVPRPLPQPDATMLRRRVVETVAAASRHFVPIARKRIARQEVSTKEVAAALRRTFEDLGATYSKFGQLIASSPGIFGDEIAAEFRTCLDTGPPIPFWRVRKIVETDLGASLEETFEYFEEKPIAAASIAAVHKATLKDGDEVAVKVVRPGVASTIAADIEIMEPLFSMLAKQIGVGIAGPLLQLLSGFSRQVSEELNLDNERRVMDYNRRLARSLGLTKIVVPEVYEEYSGMSVLTMEYIPGVAIDDLESITSFGFDPRPLVEDLVKAWFVTAARYGAFHGDVHAGNLIVIPDGRVAVLDWGIVGRLDDRTMRFLRNLVAACLGEDSAWISLVRQVRETYGAAADEVFGPDDEPVAEWIRKTLEPVLTKPFGEVNLSVFFTEPQQRHAGQLEEEAKKRSIVDILRMWRKRRRLRNLAERDGIDAAEFDHGTFLLGKQLVYFERYGKLFLSDKPLLSDTEFFSRLLDGEPLVIQQD
jgi:predicted unusual protein kinase regulating ubiquinone biosynthesis (AarF/ABC1/UbiB family)